jgi:hypothetical protein
LISCTTGGLSSNAQLHRVGLSVCLPFRNRFGVSNEKFHDVKSLSTFTERTFRKAPQKPPSAVSVYGVDPSTVRVVWRYVAPSLEEEPLIGYKVNTVKYPFDICLEDKISIL